MVSALTLGTLLLCFPLCVHAAGHISGTVFEDVNYGGGAGRSRSDSSGVVRPGARVEFYNSAGSYLNSVTTNASGVYTSVLLGAGNYTVRVVNSTVTSSRTGYVAGLLAVQTFRTNASSGAAVAVTDYVGGQNPSLAEPDNGFGGTVLNTTTGVFSAGLSGTAQSITNVTLGASDITGVDFGFNFDTVVNTNDSDQGSLRQFLLNANALSNSGLAVQGQSFGKEVSIFMISDGQSHPGLSAGRPNLLSSGVAVITLATALPPISSADTTLDATTQTANVGDTNAAVLGTGGTVGADGLVLNKVAGPEVEIRGSGTLANGIQIQANNVIICGLAINGFGTASGQAGIRIDDTYTGTLIEKNILGSTATSFSDPGAASRNWAGIDTEGGDSGTIQNNLVGFSRQVGLTLQVGSNNWTVNGNEIRDNGLDTTNGDGIAMDTSSTNSFTGNLVTGTSSQGIVVGTTTGNLFTNNTVKGNGVGISTGLVQSAGITIRTGNVSTTLDRNVVTANYGAGIQVNSGANGVLMTRNSFSANGTITARNGGGATGQIGIDLNSASDDINLGTAPFYTLNDSGDVDTGGNGLLNFPVLAGATIAGGNLILTGFARPGSSIELFLAESPADPTGFGEGKSYLATLVEGSGADLDATTGSYGPAAINGIAQGTDTTNRFRFVIPLPGGVGVGSVLTSTATLAGSTSEFSGNVTVTATISGTVFEDLNYGGGAGRSWTAASGSAGSARSGARVELFNGSGAFLSFATTDAGGSYSFGSLAAGNYTVRVVNSSVTSSRSGYVAGLLPVQTFRTNANSGTAVAVTDYLGGQNPSLSDAGNAGAGSVLNTATGVFTSGISGTAQSLTNLSFASTDITGVDFGFNFDTVVNTNDAGQGSLRQFITNANALGGGRLPGPVRAGRGKGKCRVHDR